MSPRDATAARGLFRIALQGWRRKETLALLAVLMLPFLVGGLGLLLMILLGGNSGWFLADDNAFIPTGRILPDISSGWFWTFLLMIAPIPVAGPPYLMIVIGAIFWSRNKSPQKILSSSWWYPLMLGVLVFPYNFIRFLPALSIKGVLPEEVMRDFFMASLFTFPFVCLFGYLYVLLGRYLYRKLLSLPRHPPVTPGA